MNNQAEQRLTWGMQEMQRRDPLTDRLTLDFLQTVFGLYNTSGIIKAETPIGICTWVKEAIVNNLDINEKRIILALNWMGLSQEQICLNYKIDRKTLGRLYTEAIQKIYKCYYRGSLVDAAEDVPITNIDEIAGGRAGTELRRIGVRTNRDLIKYIGKATSSEEIFDKISGLSGIGNVSARRIAEWFAIKAGTTNITNRSRAEISSINTGFMQVLAQVINEFI